MGWLSRSLIVAAAGLACVAWPCAYLVQNGNIAPASENVVILWDHVNKRQHFVRDTVFSTNAKEIAYIIPLPSQPELAEADPELFNSVERAWGSAQRAWEQRGRAEGWVGSEASIPGGIEILEEKTVAGYDATVLKAKDPAALRAWLEKNEFPLPPAITQWAEPYTKGEFVFVALKLAKGSVATQTAEDVREGRDDQGPAFRTGALRMSFATDQPYYPYREPVSATPRPPREWRVMFVSTTGVLPMTQGQNPLSIRTEGSYLVKDDQAASFARLAGLPAGAVRTPVVITKLTSSDSTPRPDKDLTFASTLPDNLERREPWVLLVMGAGIALLMYVSARFWAKRTRSG